MEIDRVSTNRWIVVIKNPREYSKLLNVGDRAEIFISKDIKGNNIEWFYDNESWIRVNYYLKLKFIKYEDDQE
ncbi:hypothetical protein JCM16418A_15160 [Paenibacillus pini]